MIEKFRIQRDLKKLLRDRHRYAGSEAEIALALKETASLRGKLLEMKS
jgi:hypothetical protein